MLHDPGHLTGKEHIMRRVGKILAVGAIAAVLTCSLGITACSNGENDEEAAGSDESAAASSTYYYEYDSDETLYIGEDTVIVPVESEGNPLDSSYDAQLLLWEDVTDHTGNFDYFEATIEDSDGFTISELMETGECGYYDAESQDFVVEDTFDPTIDYDTDDKYYLFITNAYDSDGNATDSEAPIIITTDTLDYDTVEIKMIQ